jgi:hypothetical protein
MDHGAIAFGALCPLNPASFLKDGEVNGQKNLPLAQ